MNNVFLHRLHESTEVDLDALLLPEMRQGVLLKIRVEGVQQVIREHVHRNPLLQVSVLRDSLGLQEICELAGELDTSRAAADDYEGENLPDLLHLRLTQIHVAVQSVHVGGLLQLREYVILEDPGILGLLHEERMLLHARDPEVIGLEPNTHNEHIEGYGILVAHRRQAVHLLVRLVYLGRLALVVPSLLLRDERSHWLADRSLIHRPNCGGRQHRRKQKVVPR
mmetsp:Transcript_9671/g.21579  ORF Transcript_9671/g.21579 Transcript_9671/m.21579 type:complete len:224 (+) Transcript_9671:622-1293(+)